MEVKCTCKKEIFRGLNGEDLVIDIPDPKCLVCHPVKKEENDESAKIWLEYLENHT